MTKEQIKEKAKDFVSKIAGGTSKEMDYYIDVNKGYSPENCRWVSMEVQNNNKTNNRLVSYNGRTQNVKQWCDELKLNYRITMRRLYEYHWSVKDAFEYEKGE